jgi:formylglycine-generating enzyme required for sulfatase activity
LVFGTARYVAGTLMLLLILLAAKGPVAPTVSEQQRVLIQAGDYTLGLPVQSPQPYGDAWFMDQTPEIHAALGAFRMDRFEVSVADYARFLSWAGGEAHFDRRQAIGRVAGGYSAHSNAATLPINFVSRIDAGAYCSWAGGRLPIEAEWVAAASGLAGRRFPWGETGLNCETANHFTGSARCYGHPIEVDSLAAGATPEGLFHLAGNLSEWTASDYRPLAGDDPEEWAENLALARGGSYLDSPVWLRNTARHGLRQEMRSSVVGFRCADDGQALGDLLRGTLSDTPSGAVPEPEPNQRFAGKQQPGAEVVAKHLGQPVALLRQDPTWVIADQRGGRLLWADASRAPVEGLPGAKAIALFERQIWICGEALWRLGEQGPEVEEQRPCTHVVANQNMLVAAGEQGLWIKRIAEDAQSVERDGIVGLALHGDLILIANKSGGERGSASIERLNADGTLESVVVEGATFGEMFYAPSITVVGDTLTFARALRRWPFYGFASSIDLPDGDLIQRGYSAPKPLDVLRSEGGFLVAHKAGIGRVDAQGIVHELEAWTAARGMQVYQGHLLWLDSQTGRLLRRPL